MLFFDFCNLSENEKKQSRLENSSVIEADCQYFEEAFDHTNYDEDNLHRDDLFKMNFMPMIDNLPCLDDEYYNRLEHEQNTIRFDKEIHGNAANSHTVQAEIPIPTKQNYSSHNMVKYLLAHGVIFRTIDNIPYIYSNANGTFYPIDTPEGRAVLINESPEEIRALLEIEKINKIIPIISTFSETKSKIISDNSGRYINFLDGVYDIFTEEVLPHSETYSFRYCINANSYDIDTDWHTSYYLNLYLQNSFQGAEYKIEMLQEIMGVAISTIRNCKIAFFLHGKSNSGKSVALNILKNLFLPAFCSTLSFEQLNAKFEPALLLGKWINISGEAPDLTANRISSFKNLVGNGTITTSFKGKDGFNLSNMALMIFACNEMPQINIPDTAFYNRIRILTYDYSLPKKEWIPDIEDHLLEEKGALLAFAIQGLRRFINNGYELTNILESNYNVERYKSSSNSFASFANDCIEECDGAFLPSGEIDRIYRKYCNCNGFKPLANNVWSRIICELFATERSKKGHSCTRGYSGIRFSQGADIYLPANIEK